MGGDIISILEVEGNSLINSYGGADEIEITIIRGDLELHSGSENDNIYLLAIVEGNCLMTSADGDDVINIAKIQGSLDLDSGSQNDQITIDKVVGNSKYMARNDATARPKNPFNQEIAVFIVNVDSGLDDDVIWLGGLGAGSVGIVKGSGGHDVCTVDARGIGGENRFDKSVLRWSGGGGDDQLVRTDIVF